MKIKYLACTISFLMSVLYGSNVYAGTTSNVTIGQITYLEDDSVGFIRVLINGNTNQLGCTENNGVLLSIPAISASSGEHSEFDRELSFILTAKAASLEIVFGTVGCSNFYGKSYPIMSAIVFQ